MASSPATRGTTQLNVGFHRVINFRLYLLVFAIFFGSANLNAQGGVLTGWGMSVCQQYSFSVCPGQVITPLNYGNQQYVCSGLNVDDVSFINLGSWWRVNKFNWNFSSATNYALSGYDQFSAFQSININSGSILTPQSYSSISGQQYILFAVSNSTITLLLNQNTFSITLVPLQLSGSSYTFCTNTQTSVVINPTIPVTGGPYTYTWTPGLLTTQAITVSPNVSTVYTLNITSSNGCTATALFPVTVTTCATATVNIVGSSHSCLTGSGDATATVVGGIGPYTYTWLPSLQTGSVTMGVSPGTYTVMVYDIGANATYSAVATLSAGIPYSIVVNTNSDCSGVITATAIVTTSSAPQTFTWISGSTWFASSVTNTVSGLTPGVWTVSVWNSLSYCVTHKTFVVTPSPPLTISVSAASFSACTGSSITLTGLASGGKPGYNYAWSNGSLTNTTSVSHAVAGLYVFTVNVVDTNSCDTSATISVSFADPPSMSIALTSNSLCFQAFNGSPNSVTLTASGSAATYTLFTPDVLSASGNSSSFSITTNPPFQSTLTLATATLVGSNAGCNVSVTTIFTVVPNPTVVITPTPVICAGESYTYTSWGANTYTWGPGSPGLSTYTGPVTVASPSVTSTYSVIGGSMGCNSPTQTSTLTVIQMPVVTINPQEAVMCRYNPITLSAEGTATSFTWSPAIGLDNLNGKSVVANPTVTQNYVVVGGVSGCTTSAVVTVTVLTFAQPTITVVRDTVCLNETVKMSGSGGDAYQWEGPAAQNFNGEHISFDLKNTSQVGMYTLSITDDKGCKGSTTQAIHIYPFAEGSLSGNFEGCVPFCEEFSFKGLNFNSNNQSTWIVGQQSFSSDRFRLCLPEPGMHTITGKLYNSKTGCYNNQTFQILIHDQPKADFVFTPEEPTESHEPVQFTNNSLGEAQVLWSWYFNDNKGYKTAFQNASHVYETEGIYPVAMVVTNEWGCADTVVKAVTIKADFNIYIPNAFTPNADARNDVFMPVMRGVQKYNLQVFDRWGEKLFESSDPLMGWDGSYRGSECKQDSYSWKINLVTISGKSQAYSGHVSLLK